MRKIDLHTHTNASDGEFSPEKLIDMAIEAGLKAIAITDHDAIASCEKAIEYAKEKDIEIIPGIEISCSKERFDFEVHVIGLFIDYKDPNLIDFCNEIKQDRIIQKKEMIKKLQDLGYDITFEEAIKLAKHSFGRPHLAKILVKKYPKEFPDVRTVFDKYLGDGKPAYVERKEKISIKEAIELIKKSKGIPILAHPGVYTKQGGEQMTHYFIELGGEGIETYYPYEYINKVSGEVSKEMNEFFKKLAEKEDILQSGGSDFHGEIRAIVKLGQLDMPYDILEKLKS